MSQIKSPDESLRQYFDELLLDDLDDSVTTSVIIPASFSESEANTLAKLPAQVVTFPAKPVRTLEVEESFESPALDDSSISNTLAEIDALFEKAEAPACLPLLAPVEETPAPTYVEPDTFTPQQWQLQKLLSAVKPEIAIDTVETPTAVIDSVLTLAPPIPEVVVETLVEHSVPVQEEIQEWVIEPATQDVALDDVPVIETVPDASMVDSPILERSVDLDAEQEPINYLLPGVAWNANGRPEWAQERFDVLLFDVAGLTLAVPLIALGQIQPLTEELTPLFGQADWFMGLQPTPNGKVRTVNTAKFVMPERYSDEFLTTARYVVSIDGVPWGLAVDAVNQPITLNPHDVKWRTERTKRPWLAGTVKEHMCALLDIPRVGQLLLEADRNVRSTVE